MISRPHRVLLAASLLAISLPFPAWGAPLHSGVRVKADRLPGQLTISAARASAGSSPLAAGVTTGTLTALSDPDHLYSVSMARGQRLEVTLTADPGTDFDLYLLWPGSAGPAGFDVAAASVATSYPEVLGFDASASGTYTLDVRAFSGSGVYTLTSAITSAVSEGDLSRLFGQDRYATAIAASARTFPAASSHDVVIASGASYADALSAVSLAGALRCPLLLTRPTSLPAGLLAELTRLGVRDVHIVGGPAAVSGALDGEFTGSGRAVFRYSGRDRYGTAAFVAEQVSELSAPGARGVVFVARGDLYPDALIVAPVAYARCWPVVLTRPRSLPPSSSAALRSLDASRVVLTGGNTAISEEIASAVASAAAGARVERVGGADRYATARLFAEMALEEYWASGVCVGLASGQGYPDALSGGAATGAEGGVMLLTRRAALPAVTAGWFREQASLGLADRVTVFGGDNAVSAEVRSEMAGLLR